MNMTMQYDAYMMMKKTHLKTATVNDNADSHNGHDDYDDDTFGHNHEDFDDNAGHNYDNEAHGGKSRWALQQDRLYFNNKIFVFNATTQQVG